jgi:glycerol-3-phosphate dehydrogenase subunit C
MRPADFAIDNCLKCSMCNTACPVYSVYPRYPGPKRLGPELERMRLEGVSADTPWVEYCLGCHRCDLACPNQVKVSEMIARAKAEHRKPFTRALRDWWFARPGLLGRLTTIAPAVSNFALSLKPMRWLMSRFMQVTPERRFPAYAKPNLRTRNFSRGANSRVLFFPGCFIRYNKPDLGRSAIRLLELSGLSVEVASSSCCGVPAIANGEADLAQSLARANVRSLARKVESGMRVVTACSSCGYMFKTGFGGVLDEDDSLSAGAELEQFAKWCRPGIHWYPTHFRKKRGNGWGTEVYSKRQTALIAANTFDIAEILMEQADAGKLDLPFQQTNLRLAYHAPCHQRSQGIGRPWFHLLGRIPGVVIEDLDAGCCGMSGTYGFKQEKYEVSMTIGQELFDSIRALQPHRVATECATCQMQIEHGTNVRAIHPIEVMLQACEGE